MLQIPQSYDPTNNGNYQIPLSSKKLATHIKNSLLFVKKPNLVWFSVCFFPCRKEMQIQINFHLKMRQIQGVQSRIELLKE